jgi:phosphopantothenoylcysteine synthetase/decarboxylase
MESQLEKKKRIAPESIKTKKAREKLRKQWEEQDLLITESALADTVDKIHKWIAANATHRVPLKEKDIRLFDQNQNAATLSRKVTQFAQKIREDMLQIGKAFSERPK